MPISKIPWTSQPQRPVAIDPYWVKRGLKAFYVLNSSLWRVNLITGRMSGSAVGTGHQFLGDRVRTSGAANEYINLGLDGFSAVAPFTVIVGSKHISGVVDWGLLRRDTPTWFGMYQDNETDTKTVSGDVFDGSITPIGGASGHFYSNKATALISSTNLRGCINGGSIAVDTSLTLPTGGGLTNVSLGASVRAAIVDNPASADFTYFGVFDGALTDIDLQLLSRNPWRLFAPQERRVFSVVVGGATILDLTAAALNFTPQSAQNVLTTPLTAGALSFTPQDAQNTLAAPLSAGALSFTPQGTQNTLVATLSVGALNFTPQDITAQNGTAPIIVSLDVGTFSFTPQDIQGINTLNLANATFSNTALDLQIVLTANLTAYALNATPQSPQMTTINNLDPSTFNFTPYPIDATGAITADAGASKMLMGVGY